MSKVRQRLVPTAIEGCWWCRKGLRVFLIHPCSSPHGSPRQCMALNKGKGRCSLRKWPVQVTFEAGFCPFQAQKGGSSGRQWGAQPTKQCPVISIQSASTIHPMHHKLLRSNILGLLWTHCQPPPWSVLLALCVFDSPSCSKVPSTKISAETKPPQWSSDFFATSCVQLAACGCKKG